MKENFSEKMERLENKYKSYHMHICNTYYAADFGYAMLDFQGISYPICPVHSDNLEKQLEAFVIATKKYRAKDLDYRKVLQAFENHSSYCASNTYFENLVLSFLYNLINTKSLEKLNLEWKVKNGLM